MNIHSISCVVLDDVSDTVLGGLRRGTLRLGAEARNEHVSSEVYPQFPMLTNREPRLEIETFHLKTWLEAAGYAGLKFSDYASGVVFYCVKHEDEGARATGASHRAYRATKGLLYPTRISGDGDGDVTISYTGAIVSDGTNPIVQILDSQSLPTVPTDDERYGLGSVTIGSKAIGQAQRLDIAFNPTVKVEKEGGDIDPEHVSIELHPAELTLRVTDITEAASASVPIDGLAGAHTDTTVYLRKRKTDGTGYEADASAVHIKMTAAGYCYIDNFADGDGRGGTASLDLRMPLKYDGTNLPLVINTASAIT